MSSKAFSKVVMQIHPAGIEVVLLNGDRPIYQTVIQTVDWENAVALARIELEGAADLPDFEESINVH